MTIKDGGAAFPLSTVDPFDRSVTTCDGMTLRDYFAGLAMQGLLAQSGGTARPSDVGLGAEYAYAMADAMLKAREAEPETCKPALQVERADARRGRWLLDKMRYQNCGPYSGWALTNIYPGDDAAAAIDAAMEKERGDE
jgi:hypothetical protein